MFLFYDLSFKMQQHVDQMEQQDAVSVECIANAV